MKAFHEARVLWHCEHNEFVISLDSSTADRRRELFLCPARLNWRMHNVVYMSVRLLSTL